MHNPMPEGDMIATLTHLPPCFEVEGIQFLRAQPAMTDVLLREIGEHFDIKWVNEARCALLQQPGKLFIALEGRKLVGFACYDVAAKGYFGPIGVVKNARGKDIGTALMLKTLHAMEAFGYGYAIIGWVGDAAPFYAKVLGATFIPGGEPEHTVFRSIKAMEG